MKYNYSHFYYKLHLHNNVKINFKILIWWVSFNLQIRCSVDLVKADGTIYYSSLILQQPTIRRIREEDSYFRRNTIVSRAEMQAASRIEGKTKDATYQKICPIDSSRASSSSFLDCRLHDADACPESQEAKQWNETWRNGTFGARNHRIFREERFLRNSG